jgi:hypothetical protein
MEAAPVFTSSYVSDETAISIIAKLLPDCLLLSDAPYLASMIETCARGYRSRDPRCQGGWRSVPPYCSACSPGQRHQKWLGGEVIALVAQVRFLPVFDVAESVSCL